MNTSPGASILEYARFYGIATNPTTTNPLDYIDGQPCSPDSIPHDQEALPSLEDYLSIIQSSIKDDLRSEKLNLSKNDAKFLSSVLRITRAERAEVDYDEYLPSIRRIEGLKVAFPALASHHESDVAGLSKYAFFGGQGGAGTGALVKGCFQYDLENCWHGFNALSDGIMDRIEREKLNCSKGSLVLLQSARNGRDMRPGDMDSCFWASLQPYRDRFYEPGPPLNYMNFDELRSQSDSPEPQMPPRPFSTDCVEQHAQCETDKSVPALMENYHMEQSRESNSGELGRDDSMLLLDEELGLYDEHTTTSGPPQEPYLSPHKEADGEMMAESGNAVDKFVNPWANFPNGHVSSFTTLDKDKTTLEDRLAPEQIPNSDWQLVRLVPTCDMMNLFSPGEIAFREDVEVPVGHPAGCRQDSQEATGEIYQAPSQMTTTSVPEEFCTENGVDCLQVNEVTGSVSQMNLTDAPLPAFGSDDLHIPLPGNQYNAPESPEKTISSDDKCHQSTADGESEKREKRKRVKRDSNSRKRRRKPEQKKAAVSLKAEHDSTISKPFTALGSLSAFMETRDKAPRQHINRQSPYFTAGNHESNENRKDPKIKNNVPDAFESPKKQPDDQIDIPTSTISHHAPYRPRDTQEPPLLFLSTTLLKTHLSLIRVLENMKIPSPTLIYRDYDKTPFNKTLQHEADIIISPSTGILLTTSQATTQLYLPGHKPSHPHLNGVNGVNSPLREDIILRSQRYERLYVFVCHSQSLSRGPTPTADKRTLASIASLMAFCDSMSAWSTVIPLLITPPTPETIVEWILSLAYKHSFELPVPCAGVAMPRSTIGFTPVNQTNDGKRAKLDQTNLEHETKWELFLRRAGLNPFAAQTILTVLRSEEDLEVTRSRATGDSTAIASYARVPGLSRFVEMSTDRRRGLFAGLVGERVLGRVESVLGRDWQSDGHWTWCKRLS